jgi:hypothetical protein
MGLLDNLRTRTELDDIKEAFNFLVIDFDFKLIGTEETKNYKAKYLVIYRNDKSKLQLEICADETWFHCEIRRIINGRPAKYSDKENCFGFEDLAILESNNNYEHMDYYAGGRNGLLKVLTTTAKLFQRNKIFFTTDNWIDIRRIQQLRDEDFQRKFGALPDKNKPTYFTELKKQAIKFLTESGYKLILDSDELPPFDYDSIVKNFVFQKGYKKLKLIQEDWRDIYFIYHIELNDKSVFEINLQEHQDVNEAVQLTMDKLRQCIASGWKM